VSIIGKAAGKIAEKLNQYVRNMDLAESAPTETFDPEIYSAPTAKEYSNLTVKNQTRPEVDTMTDTEKSEPGADIDTLPRHVTVDIERLQLLGIITPLDAKNQIAEEFRLIKRPLIRDAFKLTDEHTHRGNLIMVTSALAGEGKSFCAVNLAMSIAMEMNNTVLLIDADVARPAIPSYLGLKADRGLLDVLLDDKIELADVILKTNIEKLSVILAGCKTKQSTELLASQNMCNLLTEISLRYRDRIIIFDSPPLLLTTESRALAAQMGQIVMVVEAGTTTQKNVLEALRQIETCHDIKLIYNKSKAFISRDYGEYYD